MARPKTRGFDNELFEEADDPLSEKQLEENGDKIDAGLKSEIETAIAETKTALEGEDGDAIKQKTEKLTELSMKMGQAIYQQQQEAGAADAAEGGEAGSGDSSSEDEDVVEAEFSEVDEDEKS